MIPRQTLSTNKFNFDLNRRKVLTLEISELSFFSTQIQSICEDERKFQFSCKLPNAKISKLKIKETILSDAAQKRKAAFGALILIPGFWRNSRKTPRAYIIPDFNKNDSHTSR